MYHLGMKDMVKALTECGFDFDAAIMLAECYQQDFPAAIIREAKNSVEALQPEPMRASDR